MFRLDSEDTRQDPYATYAEIRRAGSAVRHPRREVWYVGRYADASRVLRNPDLFSNRKTGVEPTLTGADGALHTRSRGVLKPAFSAMRIADMDDAIRSLADDLAAGSLARGESELIEEFAAIMPAAVIARLLGIDDTRLPDIRRWSAAIVSGGAGRDWACRNRSGWASTALWCRWRAKMTRPPERATDPRDECRSFLIEHFARNGASRPGSYLFDTLAHQYETGKLTREEMLNLGILMFVAGTETTTNLIGNAVLLLAREPRIQAHLRSHPDSLDAFVEEALRYEAPVQRRIRYATTTTRIGKADIPAGARIEVLVGSANRDPERFADADQFRFDRKPNTHLSFGQGPHSCLGAQLARREAFWALTALLRNSSTIRLSQPRSRIVYPSTPTVRGPRRLHVTFS